jgi:hypothetical protein
MKEPRQQKGQVARVLENEGTTNFVSDPQISEVREGARPRVPSHKLRDFYT